MASPDLMEAARRIELALAAFEREHPEVVEAMRVMNISFPDYLQALARLKQETSVSGNAATR